MLVWSIGEMLWDVFPDKERLGGAPLNFCANILRLGDQARLFSALGDDERGHKALKRMSALGLTAESVQVVKAPPTGIATVGKDANGEPAFVIPRPAAFDETRIEPALLANVQSEGVDWLYIGTLIHTNPAIEQLTTDLVQRIRPARVFYDMNLRTGLWTLPLVQRLSELASVLKLNEVEAETLFHLTNSDPTPFSLEEFCRIWAATYHIDVICVTLGPAGCYLHDGVSDHRAPGFEVTVRDTVGAGDAFAAGFLHGYHRNWPMLQTARFANALGAIVASRAGATPDWTKGEVLALSESPNVRIST